MNPASTTGQSGTLARPAIETAVREALANVSRVPAGQIQPDSQLEDDLGLDSMSLIHVNIRIEEQLGCALSIGDAPEQPLLTVRDLTEFIETIIRRSGQEAR
jgi:acyl carrier protein